MTDILTHKQRSKRMSQIRSKWTKQEILIHNYLKGLKIKHQMHPSLAGNPDILLTNTNTAVFIHGCFWHKCPKCYREPKSNKEYWLPKLAKNVSRHKKNARKLRKEGFKVIVIWEHEVEKKFQKVINKLIKKQQA